MMVKLVGLLSVRRHPELLSGCFLEPDTEEVLTRDVQSNIDCVKLVTTSAVKILWKSHLWQSQVSDAAFLALLSWIRTPLGL